MDTRSAENREKKDISSKKGSNRTEADELRLAELETRTSFWIDQEGNPTIPASAIRGVIENGARKLKQGPQVREGLVVESVNHFRYDKDRYGETMDQLCKNCQFTVPVKVGQSRIMRTRAKFELPWSCVFHLDCDDNLVDQSNLAEWLDIAGRRIGLGDWRPQKSGHFGTFSVGSITVLE